ncbi:hypothetical protein lerEdw1_018359 [Lerista edwardsae]|nr:hypothetical protein lerEdw1_018359 [Lerista edwardsae]
MMTQLEKKDSGNYRCGIGKNNVGLYAGVNLTVWEVDSNSNTGDQPEGRMALTTEDDSRTFKVSISKLRSEDSGMYKCGTGSLDVNATVIQLQVVEELVFFNILNDSKVMSEPQTTGTSIYGYDVATYKYVTTGIYKERSSKTEPNLLSIVLPVLVILSIIAVTVIIVLVKIRQRRMLVISTIATRNPGVEIPLTEQNRAEEHRKEENRNSTDEQDSAVDPGKEVPTTSVYCLVSYQPSPEDSREND